jgi:hypothetical protein
MQVFCEKDMGLKGL